MEEKLKEILLKYYNEYSKIPKPKSGKVGGTYYGSTELFQSIGNHLEFLEDVEHTVYDYGGSTNYKHCYLLKIGGAYKISRKEIYEELRETLGGKGYVPELNLCLIDKYGTNYSVIGFGYK